MSPEQIEALTHKLKDIVEEYSKQHGVHMFMCAVVEIEVPPKPFIDVTGYTNMTSTEIIALAKRIDQIYEFVHRQELLKQSNENSFNFNLN